MATKFFTNHKGKTLLQKLEGIFHHMDVHYFDALVGYFRMSGYHLVYEHLDKVKEVRILVGINIDKLVWKAYQDGIEFVQDKETTKEKLMESLVSDVQTAEYAYEVEKGMLHFMEGVRTGKIRVKAHPSKTLHAKIYIFRQQHEHEHAGWGSVITGSSNLTEPGLERNFEFNVELRDHDDVKFAVQTFEDLWLEGIELNPDFIEKLKRKTYLNDEFTPFEIYIKFLIEYFGKSIEYDPDIANDLPKKYTSLRYQVDAVKQGVEMLKRHNGFFLADVVGLGKTVVATMIMKRFYHINGWKTKVLVVYPPALKNAWVNTIEDFDLPFKVDFISNGSLHKISQAKAEGYDLVIVDEAHKFRSDTADMFHQLQTLCKTKRKNPGPDGDRTKKVILVSATPLNNRPEDIRNLILLFQDGRNSTLDLNLIRFFRSRIDRYNKLKLEPDRNLALEGIRQLYEEIRTGILQQITIRRTRTDIRTNEEYWQDMVKQGLTFPEVEKPKAVLYQLAPSLNALFEETMGCLRNPNTGLKYYRYQAIRFLTEPYKSRYENADLISGRLAFIMKTLLVKRLDSSFHSFIQSLKRYRDANRAMIVMFQNDRVHIAPPLDVSKHILEGDEEILLEKMEKLKLTDPSIQTFTAEDFDESFLMVLKQDQTLIDILVEKWEAWQQTGQDPKLDEFVRLLNNGMMQAKNGHRKKLVVFSEFA
ncbi:MAG: helicase, partial [Bacteroidetes bacterium]|nr:helicase [Bacteroidota bacterium]